MFCDSSRKVLHAHTKVSDLYLRYYAPALMQKAGRTAPFQAMHILAEAMLQILSGVRVCGMRVK